MKRYTVTAVPHQGFDAYFRAGHRFGPDPVEVTVLDEEPGPDAERRPYELAPSQLEQLRKDPRVRVEAASDAPAARRAPAPDRREGERK